MADIKITDLVVYTDPTSTDVLPIVDVGSDITKKVSIADMMENAGTGTAAAPGISFDGDNDTGIYHPANDQVAVSAGGTQALLVESTGVTVPGNLTVQGTTTTIDTATLVVEDKNIELGNVTTPTDVTADGGGITLKGATDKTINWVDSTDAWTFSEHVNIASAKEYRIAGTSVLTATTLGSGVVTSSLTSVGTITTGTWNATQIATAYIADDAITTDKINGSAVGTTEIADDAVTADKLANTAVTAGSYTAADITVDAQGRITAAASGEISTAEIADDAVTAAKLADTAVTAGSYTAADITVDAQGRITAAASGTISTAEIADSAVTTAKINNDAVTADKLADTTVTAGSYTAADITVDAQGRITAAASGTISTAEIADDAVTAAKLADTAVTAGSYTAADITVDAQGRITAAASGTIGTAEIADDAVTSAKIADGTIVNGNVSASAAIAGTKIDADFGDQDLTVDTDRLFVDVSTNRVGINCTPSVTLDINATDAVALPHGTEAQRPSDGGTPANLTGYIRFNSDTTQFEGHNGTSWASVGGGAQGGGSDQIFFENDQTVNDSYSITANKNAMSAGPITISASATVTIPSGSRWVIV